MSVNTLTRILARLLGPKTGCRFHAVKEVVPNQKINSVLCGGHFYPWLLEDEEFYDCDVVLHTHPLSDGMIDFTDIRAWSNFKHDLRNTMLHEFNHRHQYAKRNCEERKKEIFCSKASDKKIRNEQNYYGKLDEIQSHAIDVALEAKRYRMTVKEIFDLWKQTGYVSRRKTVTLYVYKRYFKDIDHPVVQRLKYYSHKAQAQLG